MLTIGEFSSASRLTVKALRMYHDEGILVPEKIDPTNGYRYYGDQSWQRAQAVKLLSELGFSHRELKEILEECLDDSELESYLSKRLSAVKQELTRMRSVHDQLSLYMNSAKEPQMKSSPELQTKIIPEVIICSIRYKGAYSDIGLYFNKLFKKAGRYYRGPSMALYHDSEYCEGDADIEAAIVVSKILDLEGISCCTLPSQTVLSLTHYGPYESLGSSYRQLFEVLPERGLIAHTPFRELYLKGPGMIFPRKAEKFITEIQIPVEGL